MLPTYRSPVTRLPPIDPNSFLKTRTKAFRSSGADNFARPHRPFCRPPKNRRGLVRLSLPPRGSFICPALRGMDGGFCASALFADGGLVRLVAARPRSDP